MLLLSTASAAGAAPFAFISHATSTGAGRVSVIDADPSAVCAVAGQTPPCVVTTLQVGASPGGVAVNPAGTFAYVANWDGTVSVIRIADIPDNISNTTVIPISNVGPRPWGVAVSPDNAKVYVGLDNGSVAEIDANTLGVSHIDNVGGMLNGIVVVGSRVYVSDATAGQVVVIDGPTRTVNRRIDLPFSFNSRPVGIVADPNGTRIYVVNLAFDEFWRIQVLQVSVIDPAKVDVPGVDPVVQTIQIDPPPPLGPNSEATTAEPGGIALSQDGSRLYVTNNVLDTVTIITLSNGSRVDVESVGISPVGIATDPTGRAYVVSVGDVSVLDPATNTVAKTVTIGARLAAFGAFATAGPPRYVLTLTPNGPGSISAQPTPRGGTYAAGTRVTLTATPDPGSQFTSWSGACSGSDPTCVVTMDMARTVTATFATQYTLFVTTLGSGTVSAQPASTSWKYLADTAVTLTATADPGFVFTSWAGACSGTVATCTVTMDAAKSVTATFTAQYTLFVTTLGSGTVAARPASANGKYLAGTTVTLTAAPAADFLFTNWSGACSGTVATCTVPMDAAKSVTATFTAVQYTLSLSKVGAGTITAQPPSATGTYSAGTVVTLTATPDPGFQFTGWANSNPCSGTGACTVMMNGNHSETATFTAVQYTLSLSKVGAGTITAQPPSATGTYSAGTVVTLTATPEPGFQFTGWANSNPCSGTGACTVMMNGNHSETATFTALPPPPPPPAPTTCDDKIKDLEQKVAADKHPWRHDHQLKAALRLHASAKVELGKAKAKVGENDKRYVRALKEFNNGKAALCNGRYWHAHHELWDSYYIAHEILKQHRR